MATWTTPKTDWAVYMDENGNYAGDYFNVGDYNRIKNNLEYLYDIAVDLYGEFDIHDMGDDKTYGDYVYADELNNLEENLSSVIYNTYNGSYGPERVYEENGPYIDFNELNRIESASLDIYTKLFSQWGGRRMLKFRLGEREIF